ncbi:unnamed protein product, partial [Bubo scandiacus]
GGKVAVGAQRPPEGEGAGPACPGTLQCRQRPEPPVSRGTATLAAALRAQLPFVQSSRLQAQLQRRLGLHARQPRTPDCTLLASSRSWRRKTRHREERRAEERSGAREGSSGQRGPPCYWGCSCTRQLPFGALAGAALGDLPV